MKKKFVFSFLSVFALIALTLISFAKVVEIPEAVAGILIGSGAVGGQESCTPLVVVLEKESYDVESASNDHLHGDLGSSPTSGNLLIAAITVGADSGTINTPEGWTLVHSGAGLVSGAMFYKVSDGSEQTVTVYWTNNSNCRIWYGEFSGIASPTLDVKAEDETYISTVTKSVSSGTTATTDTDCAFAVVWFAVESGYGFSEEDRALSNSFSEIRYYTAVSSRAGYEIGSKTISSAAAIETTMSTVADTGDEAYGVVAVFKAGS